MAFVSCLYYLYIDECGDEGPVTNVDSVNSDHNWFTTAGIIVKEENVQKFDQAHTSIIKKHFTDRGIALPPNFKLHYSELRYAKNPYNQMSDLDRRTLADDVFSAINSIDCSLVSCTIDKSRHYAKYQHPINVRAYTLLVCLERFWYFLNEHGCEGSVIYERFHLRQRKTVGRAIQKLQSMQNHNTFPDLGSIKHTIRNGDPIQEKVLQSLISLHMCRT